MNRGGVGEERGSKEMDGCPLTLILGYNWLRNHNLEINWQTKDVKMSRCPLQCSTCRVEDKREAKIWKSTTS
jgi:hypothetical protein